MPATMKDIATELGVSVVTISKVLRGHPDISSEMRQRVLKRMEELRYRPNQMARSLVTGRSFLIGLIVPDLLHPFFAEVAKSLARALRVRGYSLIIASSEEDPEIEDQELEHMIGRRLDGLVIASCASSGTLLERLHEEAYVLIDRVFEGVPSNFVGVDDFATGLMATEHLIARGCKRIAHIRGRANSTGERRYKGYREALRRAGLRCSAKLVIQRKTVDMDSRRQGAEAMEQLLELKPRPDGVFCYNDPMAIGAMNVALAAGLRVPEDVALIGCGNLHYDDCLQIALSSVDQQSRVIGEKAAELLLGIIEAKTPPAPATVVLTPVLVERASSRRNAGVSKRGARVS